MLEVNQVVIDDSQGLAGRAGLASSRFRNDAVRNGSACTNGKVGVLNTCDSGSQAINDEADNINGAVLDQFNRQGDFLGRILEHRQSDRAEGHITGRSCGVFANNLTNFASAVRGREVESAAERRGKYRGDFTHAAISLHFVNNHSGDFRWYGVSAFCRRRGRHGVTDGSCLFGCHVIAVTQVNGDSGQRINGHVFLTRFDHLGCRVEKFVSLVFAHLLNGLDLALGEFDFVGVTVKLGLIFGRPQLVALFVQKVIGLGAEIGNLLAQCLDVLFHVMLQ